MAGKIEDDYAGSFLDQARLCVRDGSYDRALALLGRAERLRPTMNGIAELVAISQVCQAATWRCSCRMQVPRPRNPDWYRVLKVEEDADSIAIKKRYRQLALLLHPDKCKNAKSEEAFKLVSEAYACLSDGSSRRSFDIERSKTYCSKCYAQDYSTSKQRSADEISTNSQSDYFNELLQTFGDNARAGMRRSRWDADLESAREPYQNKRVDRKSMFRDDVLKVSQSLDGLLNRLRKNSQEEADRYSFSCSRSKKTFAGDLESTPETSKTREAAATSAPYTDPQFGYLRDNNNNGQSSDITNKFFSKRVSSIAETLPAKKLFEDEEPAETSSSGAAAAVESRRQIRVPESTPEAAAAESETTTPPTWSSRGHHNLRGGNLVGDESIGTRTEYTESLFCCGSRKSAEAEIRGAAQDSGAAPAGSQERCRDAGQAEEEG